MAGASVEATLALWAYSLRDVQARMRPLFTQDRVSASAGLFLDGLLGEERRKTGWIAKLRRPAWRDDPARMAAAHIPAGTGFATKPALERRALR